MIEDKDYEELLNVTLRDLYWINIKHVGHGVFNLTVGPLNATIIRSEIETVKDDCGGFLKLIRSKIENHDSLQIQK